MPRPRSELISLSDTPYYHCVSRCVRRAFLCGEDRYTGQSYEHRRGWLEKRLLYAADAFAIKVCSYAIMSNHYHVVLNVRLDISAAWSEIEVVERWHRLFNGTVESTKYLAGETLSAAELIVLKPLIALWRERLSSISWLMRVVNESIARRANAEDDCTGSFWEGRFKSQALLDERALLSCMTYVDLNPIRAGLVTPLDESNYTSIKKRIAGMVSGRELPNCLERFVGNMPNQLGIPYTYKDYFNLVDWSAKRIVSNHLDMSQTTEPTLLGRIDIDAEGWTLLTTQFEQRFKAWVGSEQITRSLEAYYRHQKSDPTQDSRPLVA